METLLQDLRYAARSLRKSPGLTLVAVLTLALGIGASTVVFSTINRLLLSPLPVRSAERLVFPWQTDESSGMSIAPLREVAELWRDQARSFEAAEIYRSEQVLLGGADAPAIVHEAQVSPSFLAFLGLRPALGWMFSTDELRASEPVVLLSYALWQSHFGGRADVLGESIRLDDVAHTIIGVMPARLRLFDRAEGADVWTPFVPPASASLGAQTVGMVARLRLGVTLEQAQGELDQILRRADTELSLPGTWKARLFTPREQFDGGLGDVLRIAAAAVGLVLLIACANVAQLLLARGSARRREIAIRAALGAGRGRLFRQLMIEALLLALAGSAAGLLLAWWGVEAIAQLRPESLTALARIDFDPLVLWFSLGASLVTGLVFGIAPALSATRFELNEMLRQESLTVTRSAAAARLRHALMVGEVGLSVVLLISAGLLIRSLQQLQRTDPGFDPTPLVALRPDLPQARYPTMESRTAFMEALRERTAAHPGVEAVTVALTVPPRYGFTFGRPEVEGTHTATDGQSVSLASNMVRSEYFRVLGIPLVEGRTFTEAEQRDENRAAIINETMERRLWPGQSAIRQRFRLSPTAEWSTVVGVAANVSATGLMDRRERLQLYTPYQEVQSLTVSGTLIIRARGDAAALVPSLRALVHDVDPEVPIRDAAPIVSFLSESLARLRFSAALLSAFAALAAVLTAVGLFGVLSYTVSQRTREIGIRIALGAERHDVLGLVARRGLGIVLVGAAVGLAGAWALTRLMQSQLYGVSATDPLTFIGVSLLLCAVALLASIIPARRATRVDPMVALRAE